jgi:hypothetical protein
VERVNVCSKCRHWSDARAERPNTGECRRYPPALLFTPAGDLRIYKSEFPHVGAGDWCGEWTPGERAPKAKTPGSELPVMSNNPNRPRGRRMIDGGYTGHGGGEQG